MRVDPRELADDDAAATEGWQQFAGVAGAKELLERAAAAIDDKIAQAFLSDAGKACLEHLKARVVDPPSWRIGDTLEQAHFREGQKSVVLQLIASVNRAAERRAAQTNPEPKPQE